VGSGEDPRGARRADATVGCRGGRRLARRPTSQTGGADVHRPHGGPLSRADFVRNCFKPAVLAANEAIAKLPKDRRPAPLPGGLRFYDLRHTCASLLIAQGASIKAVQAQLGHATASITLDTYGHLFPSEMEALADRLEMVRDAALAKRARTQRGPTDNRLGETAGG
jgi:integrase